MPKFLKDIYVRLYQIFYGSQEAPEMTVEQLKEKLDRREDVFILDVREPGEYELCHLQKAHLIPLRQLPERLQELQKSKEIVVHCKVGGRSSRAVEFLRKSGFSKVHNLKGGIDAWAERIDPSLPRY
ncbi:MAG: rhodanese-like domain-containing protein [Elusimicrobia bacterium]|nr:rhodanese-like domain-containing protein [Elusimicrobiota bacterium]